MAFDPQIFRELMARFASGVTVVTCAAGDEFHGVTASAFTSVSLNPPLVLVCLDKKLRSNEIIEQTGGFGVSILNEGQIEYGKRFAGMLPGVTDKFESVETHTAETGSPLLFDALAWLDCKLWQRYDGGDHWIVVGEVVAGDVTKRDELTPLGHYNRAWSRVVPIEET